MANNIYVNLTQVAGGTLTNGYAYGDAANDGSTKLLPKPTIASAWSVMTNDDVMVINDGPYAEAAWLYLAGKTGCSITAENDHQVTWTNATGADNRIFHVDESASPFTLGKLIVDGEDIHDSCFTLDTAPVTPPTVTFDGTWLRRAAVYILSSSKVGTLTFQDGARLENSPRFLNLLQTENDATYNFTDTTFINDDEITLSANPVRIVPTVATGLTVNITNVTGSFIRPLSDTASRDAFEIGGVDALIVDGYTFSFDGYEDNVAPVNYTMNGLFVIPHATLSTNKVRINGYTTGDDSRTKQNYGVRVGAEDATRANTINDVLVTNATVTNCDHGVYFGFITEAVSQGCSVNNSDLAFALKGTTNCIHSGGFSKDIATYSMLGKFDTNGTFANITHITDTVSCDTGVCVTQDNEGVNPSVGTNYININVLDNLGTDPSFNCENDSSTANYYNCNVYQPNGNTANRFNYQATSTDVLATWETAVNVANTASGNTEVNPLLNSDYTLSESSPLLATGIRWWTGANPMGADGEPFTNFDLDIGGFQSLHGDYHPSNL